ncbi:DUF567-domain-containing protein, partial [Polychaeton citri CBS 116435]
QAPAFAPFEPPLGPQPNNASFYMPQQVTLAMKEKVFSLSGDDFTVQTADGAGVLKCKGKTLSIRDRKVFTDMQDNEIFTIKNKMLSLHKSFYGESPQGHNFEVKGHFKLMGSKSTVEFQNASDSSTVELSVKGDWIDRSAKITLGDRPVAEIARKFLNVREIFGGQQTYYVTVAPNVDLSLIAAICVCLDERQNE